MSPDVVVVGGGLAGCEAAWHVAQAGLRVRLYEMRPVRQTEVHRTGDLAELVCSNSFRGASLEHAPGLLKEEMRRLGSLVMSVADRVAVPAGAALAVDREAFARGVTEAIETHPLVEVCREEVREIPTERPCVVATGPLTSPPLAEALRAFTGERHLSFFDAAAPIVTLESVDMAKVFRASRYGRGDDDAYLNCPLDEGEYRRFWEALVTAEIHQPHDFEADLRFFEGCLPVEEMARRGYDTLRFGPMKPVGLVDPRTGRQPYAVVQLRQDNREGTLFNLVGFQTSLKWGEQRRVFRLIPGLENAEFVRYGVMHRNLFLCSPRLLLPTLQARRDPGLLFAGQMTGVEGYVESAATGIVAGINAARLATGREPLSFPVETAVGALCHYIATANPETFQPMNIAFGLLPPPDRPVHDRRRRRQRQAQRALAALAAFVEQQGLAPAGRRWQGAL
ncbi:MAG: methylenetetrahydrofolate--tRNA-(uracil(54)-C(5))-methyltransferase (FADH(2)-oxidizing) TrmFO [Clostridia bacterium]|nr:methylenetetrahydrofolate--tRNA-(uracil(54)-C(5))-methyltransferase (FADH(2)-oxidizing) TrmFO [Clostridia bacterium]